MTTTEDEEAAATEKKDDEGKKEPTARLEQAQKAASRALTKNSEHLLRVTLPLIIENRNPLSRFRKFLD